MKRFLLLLFIFTSFFCHSQSTKIDSLEKVLKKAVDTAKVNVLNALALEYLSKGPETALAYADQAAALSDEIDFRRGKETAFDMTGAVYYDQGDYNKALKNYSAALKSREDAGDKKGISKSYNNIGSVNVSAGEYEKALKNFLKSLKICEEIGDKKSMPLNNIAVSYFFLGNYEKSLEFYIKALKTFEELGNKKAMINPSLGVGNVYLNTGHNENALIYYKQAMKLSQEVGSKNGLAKAYNNIGQVYEKLQNNDTALSYYLRSLRIKEELGDKSAIANSLLNIGNSYCNKREYDKALEYYEKALQINQESGNKNGRAKALLNIGILYSKKNNVEKALENIKKSLSLADSISSKDIMMEGNEQLSEVYVKNADYKNAYTYYKLHSTIKDSILNEENSKNMADIQTKYETDQKEKEIEILTKDKALKDTEIKNQRIVKNGLIIGCLLMLLVAFLVYNRYRIKQKASEEIGRKNKDITDSINYARQIQNAILPSVESISKAFSQSFILYKPKDIVSGDFYFFAERDGKKLIAVVDCTGHGVPGAFMSMIGNNLLNEIINEKGIMKPSQILTDLHKRVRTAMKQDIDGTESKDGMDIALCCFDLKTMQLEFSGANRPLYIFHDNELQEIVPNKFPIGGFQMEAERIFTNHTIELQKYDTVYLFSDGYADQFGGEKGKKFMVKNFKKMLLENQHLSVANQKNHFDKAIETWKGGQEQVDDILVIGIRV